MEDLKNKTNNEILLEIKQMELDYDAIKQHLIRGYNLLESIENRFKVANDELNKRLTGK